MLEQAYKFPNSPGVRDSNIAQAGIFLSESKNA